MVTPISFDAELLELRLPEDHRVLVRIPGGPHGHRRKLGKPIVHEVADGDPYPAGSTPPKNGSHLLAVYDGPWVYYEIQAEESTKEGPVQ